MSKNVGSAVNDVVCKKPLKHCLIGLPLTYELILRI
jgi:hypothetical protein